MENAGNIFLYVAFVLCVYALVISFVGGKRNRPTLVVSARNAMHGVSLLVYAATIVLIGCFLTGRYHLEYVYQYSNSTMPTAYKIASLWGGQNGSLLFWLLILCTYSSIAIWRNRQRDADFTPYVITTLASIALFFLSLLIFAANPFDVSPITPPDGKGLNPLLQNYYMMIHPPSLYLGYVGMSVPFAFAMAALISGRLDNQWILRIREWTLIAWFFLSCGNLLGASWAYEVLGWGGYWGWDPVENAAFIPWLTATAFLHSIIIQEKRGMLRTWNMILVILSFVMTLVGTFLTRSGIISSVHSFAQSSIGYYFFGFLLLTIAISGALVLYRLKDLRSKNTLDSFVSREATFLFNNLVLVGAAFAVLWGTLFPVLSEWVRGTKISVGPSFFNGIMVPIGLFLLLLTGIGPIVAWRKTTPDQLKRDFLWPVASSIVTSVLVYFFVSRSVGAVVSFSFCTFVMATIFSEYKRGVAVRRRTLGEDPATALLRLVASNRRRYGGYIVHVGIVLLFIGFTGNMFKKEQDLQMRPGETAEFGRYQIRYERLTQFANEHKEMIGARLQISKAGSPYAVMEPTRVFYRSQVQGEPPQPATEVSIKRSLREDLYIALLTFDPAQQSAFLKVVINPLVQFIWIGGLFLILGTLVGVWPAQDSKRTIQNLARAAMLLLCLLPALGHAAPSMPERIDEVAKKLKCICGCNFPDLASCSCGDWAVQAKAEIEGRLSRGEDEATILKYFVAQHGESVLTSPIREGFNYAAWVVPAVALLIAISGVTLAIRRWHRQAGEEVAAALPGPANSADDKYKKQLDHELYGTES